MCSQCFSLNKPGGKSLNNVNRKRKLIKITLENIDMVKRIKQQKSQYNVKVWAKEREKEKSILGNICEFPYQLAENRSNKNLPDVFDSRSSLTMTLPDLDHSKKIVHQQILKTESLKFFVDIYEKKR